MEDIKNVYITPSGKKYHINKNCSSIGKNIIEISLTEAEKRDKLPCLVCSQKKNDNQNNKIINFNKYKSKKSKYKNNIKSEDAENTLFNESSIAINFNDKEKTKIFNIINEFDNKEEEKNDNFQKEGQSNISDSNDNINNNNDKFNNTNSFIASSDNESDYESSNESDNNSDNKTEVKIIEGNNTNLINNNYNKINSIKKESIIDTDNNHIMSNIEKLNRYKIREKIEISKKYLKNKFKNNDKKSKEEEKIYIFKNDGQNNNYSENIFSNNNDIQFNPIYSNNNVIFRKNNCLQNELYNYSYTHSKNNTNNNMNKVNYICQKYDMIYLEETYNNATIVSFDKVNKVNNSINIYDNQINDNGVIIKDSFIFKFEIKPYNVNCKTSLKLDIGFKLKYINSKDINFIADEHSINMENMNIIIGSLSESIKITKKLAILKNTGIVYSLININKGKFFIIGKRELEKRKQNIFLDRNNTEIFYLQNFLPIPANNLKYIQPVINFNKKYLDYFEIKINDKNL